MRKIFATALVLFTGLFYLQGSHAATFKVVMTLPTTRADASPFDPLTEMQRVEVGCGLTAVGPFDIFTKTDTGPFASLQHSLLMTAPDNSNYHCVAFAVDTGGRISEPSNVADYVYTAPPSSLVILGLDDVVATGTINFSFALDPVGAQ